MSLSYILRETWLTADTAWRKAPDIAYSYHGELIGTDGKPIKLDVATLTLMQEKVFYRMLKYVPRDAYKEERDFKRKVLAGHPFTPAERMAAMNALLGRLAHKYEKSMDAELVYRYRLMHRDMVMLEPKLVASLKQRSPASTYLYSLFGNFLEDLWTFVTEGGAALYESQCRREEVPIPPDWGGGWNQHASLDRGDDGGLPAADEVIFVSTRYPKVELWTFQDPNVPGGCAALSRKDAGNVLQLNGMICQSKRTGKACFWDNIDQLGQRITADSYRIQDIQNGNRLAENCVECHRGRNAYLMHPGAKIDFRDAFPTDPEIRYQPVSTQFEWKNPNPFLPALAEPKGCVTCHEVAGLGATYCDNVMKSALERTMPSIQSPAKWSGENAGEHADHVKRIREACEAGRYFPWQYSPAPAEGQVQYVAEGERCDGDPKCEGSLKCGYKCSCSTGLNFLGLCIGGEAGWVCLSDQPTCMIESDASQIVGE